MRYIISQDKPDSLQDALKVVAAYSHMKQAEAYLFHIRFLIKKNRVRQGFSKCQHHKLVELHRVNRSLGTPHAAGPHRHSELQEAEAGFTQI